MTKAAAVAGGYPTCMRSCLATQENISRRGGVDRRYNYQMRDSLGMTAGDNLSSFRLCIFVGAACPL